MAEQKVAKIEINGVWFSPVPGINYRNDYIKAVEIIQTPELWASNIKLPEGLSHADLTKELVEKRVYRQLILNDLWFILNFVLETPNVNRKFIVDACQEVETGGDWTLDLWARFHFKMIDLNEDVPTPDGWKKHGGLKPGDFVFGVDGIPTKVIAKTKVFTDGDCYRVTFDKGYSVIVGGEHLWTTNLSYRKRLGGNKRTNRQQKIINTVQLMDEVTKSKRLATRVLPSVNVCSPIQFTEKELPINPYLFGCWLGDGNSRDGGLTCAYSDLELINHLNNEGVKIEKRKSSGVNSGMFSLDKGIRGKSGTGLTAKLRILGVKNNKHIPEIYKQSSVTQRIALLQGLMDTDGTCDTRGTATFCNINERLIDDVFELVAGLGLKPQVGKRITKINNAPYVFWQITFQAHFDKFPVFRLSRKQGRAFKGCKTRSIRHAIVSVEPVEKIPCSCIEVEASDGQYLIGKHFVPTHNSSIRKARNIQRLLKYPDRCQMIVSHTRPAAKKHLIPIKQVLENSVFLKTFFDDRLYGNPDKESPKWSEDGGLVEKGHKDSRLEANLEAWGLKDGMPIGSHFDYIDIDDLETKDDVKNPDVVYQVREAVDLCNFLLSETGVISFWGTPYSHEGIYIPHISGKLKADGTPKYKFRRKPCTDNGRMDGNPVLMDKTAMLDLFAELNREEGGQYAINCQMLIDSSPVGSRKFNPEDIHEIEPELIPRNVLKFMMVDPAGDDKGKKSDAWAIIVCGVDPKVDDIGASNVYIMNAIISPLSEASAPDEIARMYLSAGIIQKIGCEKVGISTAEIHVANALAMKGRRISEAEGTLQILRPAGREKDSRILDALSWPMANGKIHISLSVPAMYRERLKMEAAKFPYWKKDGLDALSYLYDMIKDYRFADRSKTSQYNYSSPPYKLATICG